MNIYSVIVLADVATATATEESNFMGFVCPLFLTAANHTVFKDENDVVYMQFETDYRFTVPADAAGIVEYKTVALDTRSTKILTTLDKATLWKGDICFILSAANHDHEVEDNIVIELPTTKLIIGQAADSQSEFYTPFSGAVASRIFDRAKTAKLQAELEFIQEAEAQSRATAAVNILQG